MKNYDARNRLVNTRTSILKLTQKELSGAIKLNQSVISRSEDPLNNISPSLLLKLQAHFNINATWIETGKGHIYITEDSHDSLSSFLSFYLSINEEDMHFFESYLYLSENEKLAYQALVSSFKSKTEILADGQ